jgi:uncharacterized membrane protein (DUF485 family)
MVDGLDDALVASVAADPRYRSLVSRRMRLGWALAALIFFAFIGYLTLIAFDKQWLGRPIADGVTTLGIPIGLGLILLGIALTGVYVLWSNRYFDAQMAAILKDHRA